MRKFAVSHCYYRMKATVGMKIILYTIFYYTHTKVNINSFSQTFFVSFHFRSLGNDTQKNTWAFLNIMNI